jgi:acylphosphatase
MRRTHILIHGDVQGVFFRSGIEKLAKKHNVKGFVRNIGNDVEAVFEGNDDDVAEMLVFCALGPKGSKVKSMDIQEESYDAEFEDFTVE